MKIIFICGCLEPGKDGVGDYTRKFSDEIMSQGHDVANLSLYDNYISEPTKKSNILRLPNVEKNTGLLVEFIECFKPDIVSFQYVNYSFHPKGLNYKIGRLLNRYIKQVPIHIMFHEIYAEGNNFKQKIFSFLHKSVIKKNVDALKPDFVSTSNLYYKVLLNRIGINSRILPLFGNISLEYSDHSLIKDYNFEKYFNVVYFATLPSIDDLKDQASLLKKHKNVFGKPLRIVLLGKSERQSLFESFLDGVTVLNLGVLEEKKISSVFKESNFGVSRVPLRLIGKSGSVISMAEHGLPIWIPVKDNRKFRIDNFRDFDYLNYFFDLNNIPPKRESSPQIKKTAKEFLSYFK
ncbi:hypothetical protein [Zunongwangia profunda]|uniref:hypothetical protein n=1 Tax=Zunongwangia profunda TaxID=398743 RepID=UPI001D180947|nr:hypothetical protein [Zunongwangia profunda]MCC4227318.1 hypothetical protein [Zunongwangia profunda]